MGPVSSAWVLIIKGSSGGSNQGGMTFKVIANVNTDKTPTRQAYQPTSRPATREHPRQALSKRLWPRKALFSGGASGERKSLVIVSLRKERTAF